MKKVLIIIMLLFGIIFSSIFFLFSSKEVTNINVKTIPKSASSYIIVDPQAVSNDIKNHYKSHPEQLLLLMDGLMEIKGTLISPSFFFPYIKRSYGWEYENKELALKEDVPVANNGNANEEFYNYSFS